jgi:hypothetical protein
MLAASMHVVMSQFDPSLSQTFKLLQLQHDHRFAYAMMGNDKTT